jgi:acyl-CoA dehydrogenase
VPAPATDIAPSRRAALAGVDESMLSLPFYEESHAEVARRAARWCSAHQHHWRGSDPAHAGATGRRILRALGQEGLLAFLDPDATDARGGDVRSLCLSREVLAYTEDLADFAFSIQALSATPILRHGTAAQRRRYLPAMASGRAQGAFAVSEEGAGSDLSAIALAAKPISDGYVLNGHKAWIACGTTADLYCVLARTGEGPGPLGLTAFLVPADTTGVRVREEVPFIAPRSLAHLAFEDCHVPADAVLGRPGGGFVIAMELLDRFRVTVGAAAVGFARRAADAALARARHRVIYGGHLFDVPTVREACADMEVKLNAAALLVARAAWEIDHDRRRWARHSSIAKLYATEAAQQIVDATVQVFGAAGLVAGSLPERLYRQIRSLRIYEGSSEVQRQVIAGALDPGRGDAPPPPPRFPHS